jgi:hypothetical protein
VLPPRHFWHFRSQVVLFDIKLGQVVLFDKISFLVANLPTHSQTFAALGRALDGLVGADTSARRTWAYNQMAYPKKKKLSLPT